MAKICSNCGTETTVYTFQFWDGRCGACGQSLSLASAVEDLNRPVPSRTEITEYLMYMDDLNAIRWFGKAVTHYTILLFVANLLYGIGIGADLIEPRFGFLAWGIVALVFVLLAGRYFKQSCPRCSKTFRHQTVFGFRVPSSIADSCAHCGLRALSQIDIRRADLTPSDLTLDGFDEPNQQKFRAE